MSTRTMIAMHLTQFQNGREDREEWVKWMKILMPALSGENGFLMQLIAARVKREFQNLSGSKTEDHLLQMLEATIEELGLELRPKADS